MHRNNKLWLKDTKKKFPKYFSNAKVLELGSGDTSGKLVIRSYFKKCEYVGVDRVGMEQGVFGVDVVEEAKSTKFRKSYFDTMLCLSMLEHDPEWRLSLSNNLKFLKPGALIVIGFGAEGNRRHDPEPWAPVKHRDFIKFCQKNRIKILDAFFEEERYGFDCSGAFDVVAKIQSKHSESTKPFTSSMVKLVPEKGYLLSLGQDILYYANRFKRNLRNSFHIKKKHFYNQ